MQLRSHLYGMAWNQYPGAFWEKFSDVMFISTNSVIRYPQLRLDNKLQSPELNKSQPIQTYIIYQLP